MFAIAIDIYVANNVKDSDSRLSPAIKTMTRVAVVDVTSCLCDIPPSNSINTPKKRLMRISRYILRPDYFNVPDLIRLNTNRR